MGCPYQEKKQISERYLKDINFHIPEWAKILVGLYTSHKKYQIKNGQKESD